MATQKPRCMVTIDDELFEQIEDYRFSHRFQNRSEAIMDLINKGLLAVSKQIEEDNKEK